MTEAGRTAGRGRARNLYPGANSGYGFYSLYHEVPSPAVRKIYVLKGGPGVGKSTFCRKIGEELLDRGFDVEFLYCSGDAGSIDGIHVPALGVEIVDGTSPHVIDPKAPGAVDTIIHLGDHWREAGLRARREQIIRDTREASRNFHRAYRYLKIALEVMQERKEYLSDADALDIAGLNRLGEALIEAVFAGTSPSGGRPRARRLFASAITHSGHQNQFESLFGPAGRRFIISGPPGSGRSTLVRKVMEHALSRGLDVEAYPDVLDPERVEHLYVPALDTAVINGSEPHVFAAGPEDERIDTGRFVDEAALAPFRSALETAAAAYRQMVDRAIDFLQAAKQVHDALEQHYVPFMDWEGIERRRRSVLQEILDVAEAPGGEDAAAAQGTLRP